MALPKLQTPTYELVLPSTNEKIKYKIGEYQNRWNLLQKLLFLSPQLNLKLKLSLNYLAYICPTQVYSHIYEL
mgnify:CR=1 FL=1